MLHDLRYALRIALRTPMVTAAAVVSLALAIGANTTIFSVLKHVILAPLPYPNAERLMAVYETKPARGWFDLTVSRLNLADFRAHSRSFERLAAFRGQSYTITSPGEAEVAPVGQVDAEFLPMFGAVPLVGRLFTADELAPGKNAVAVIGERLWRSRFNADPDVVGKPLVMNGKHFTITGVLPERFEYIYGNELDVWVPITNDPDMNQPRIHRNLVVHGLLRPGENADAAQTELNGIMANIARAEPPMQGCGARVVPLSEDFVGWAKRSVWLLQVAVGFILLIACANISNLLLARSTARRRELGMRLALGASKLRLLRECLVESALLAGAGGGIGLLVATWGVDLARRFAPLPRAANIHLDATALTAALIFTTLAAIVAGVTPALRTAEASISEALRGASRTSSPDIRSRWTRDILVAGQIALAFALLAGAVLLVDSFRRLNAVTLGFDYSNRLITFLLCDSNRYPTRERVIAHGDELLERVRAIPGVRSATIGSTVPLSGNGDGTQSFEIAGWAHEGQLPPVARYRNIWPGFFGALGIPTVSGREFASTDSATAPPVVMVNQSLVKRYLNGGDAIGKRIRWGRETVVEIVGVVTDAHFDGPASNPEPEIYFPFAQSTRWGFYLVVHGAMDAAEFTASVRRVVAELDPEQPLARTSTMATRLDRRFSQPRWYLRVIGAFALVAVVLALVGVFGVMQYTVSMRMREFGIRQALGASPGDIARLVFRHGGLVTICGLVAGVGLSLATSRLLVSHLFGVRGNDPSVLALTGALLLGAVMAALVAPARSARNSNPSQWLRDS